MNMHIVAAMLYGDPIKNCHGRSLDVLHVSSSSRDCHWSPTSWVYDRLRYRFTLKWICKLIENIIYFNQKHTCPTNSQHRRPLNNNGKRRCAILCCCVFSFVLIHVTRFSIAATFFYRCCKRSCFTLQLSTVFRKSTSYAWKCTWWCNALNHCIWKHMPRSVTVETDIVTIIWERKPFFADEIGHDGYMH